MTDKIIDKRYNLTASIVSQAEKIKSHQSKSGEIKRTGSQEQSFGEILNQRIKKELSFSKHAAMRTEERNIQVTGEDLNKLGEACSKAGEKGIKEALFIMNDSAFIVNTPNRTVITVVDKNDMKNNIFTNIDGAMFL